MRLNLNHKSENLYSDFFYNVPGEENDFRSSIRTLKNSVRPVQILAKSYFTIFNFLTHPQNDHPMNIVTYVVGGILFFFHALYAYISSFYVRGVIKNI